MIADIVPNETGSTTLTELTYRRLILASVVLGRKLAAFTRPGEHVGVMLPNAVGTVATFFALQSQARVPAMMNFTTGAEGMLSCCVAAGIETILTSRRAVQKGKLDRLVEGVGAKVRIVYLEDVRASIGLRDKLRGMLVARCAGDGCLVPGWMPASPALVLFTSGSEGAPKGVVHSHRSLLANCAQLRGGGRLQPGGPGVQCAADVPRVRHDRHAAAADVWRAQLPVSVAAALQDGARDGLRRAIDHHVRHRHVSDGLRAQGQPAGLPVAALHLRRRGSGAAGNARRLHGAFQEADLRRLWRDRNRAGAGPEHLGACARKARSAACCRASRLGWSRSPASTRAAGFWCVART